MRHMLTHQTHQFITSSNKLKQIGVQIEPVFDALACRKMRPCINKAAAPSSSEAETPRTPSLVARLMGIDGLPDEKPSPSSPRKENNLKQSPNAAPAPAAKGKKKKKNRAPLRSLSGNVETPPRTSWDGALQPLKENVRLDGAAPQPYTSLPTSPASAVASSKKSSKRRATAKEIVRQAMETVATRRAKEQQHNHLALTSSTAATDNKENVSPGPVHPVREDKLLAVGVGNQAQAAAKRVPSPEPRALGPRRVAPNHPPPPPLHTTTPPTVTGARKPDGCERFATRIKKPCAPTPPPPPRADPPARTSEDPEYAYIRTVLERGGFMRASPPPRRISSSLASPIDPIVFHLLELEPELPADDGPLRHRWNRKLMFHLAQEILADLILLDLEDSARLAATGGAPLLARVWKKVQSFPAADCRVVGDIDALVATDLEPARVRRLARHPAAADVAEELAERVLEDLVGEESLSLSLSSSPSACSGSITVQRRDA
jgi:hypothetical protein